MFAARKDILKESSGLMLTLCGLLLMVLTPIEIVRHAMAESSIFLLAIPVACGVLLFKLGTELIHSKQPLAQIHASTRKQL
jgi:hypothetical protein